MTMADIAARQHALGRHDHCEPTVCDRVEGALVQVRDGERWLDYARATLPVAKAEVTSRNRREPGRWRIVHWINRSVLVEPS